MPLYFAYGSNMDAERHGLAAVRARRRSGWRGSSGIGWL